MASAIRDFGGIENFSEALMRSEGYTKRLALYSNKYGTKMAEAVAFNGDKAIILIDRDGTGAINGLMNFGTMDGFIDKVFASERSGRMFLFANAHGENMAKFLCIYGEQALDLAELSADIGLAVENFGAKEAYLKTLIESDGYARNIATYSNRFGEKLVDVFIKCGDEAAIIIRIQGGDAAYTFMN